MITAIDDDGGDNIVVDGATVMVVRSEDRCVLGQGRWRYLRESWLCSL